MAHKILKRETHEKAELMKKDELAITVDTPQPDPLRLSIGTVRQGTTPSVTNSGSDQNVILDFVLPSQVTAVPNTYPLGIKFTGLSDGILMHDNKSVYYLSSGDISSNGPTNFYGINSGKPGDIIHVILGSGYLIKGKPGKYSLTLHNRKEINTNELSDVNNKIISFLCNAENIWVEIGRNWSDLVSPFVVLTTEDEYNRIPSKDPNKIYLIKGE